MSSHMRAPRAAQTPLSAFHPRHGCVETVGVGGRTRLRLGALLVILVMLAVGCLFADDFQLLHFQNESKSTERTANDNALVAANIDATTPEPGTLPPLDTPPPPLETSPPPLETPPPPLEISPPATTAAPATPSPAPLTPPPQNYNRTVDGDLATNFECVGWRRTGGASPDGRREPASDADCAARITDCVSGYCLFRHKTTNATRRAILMHSNSLPCSQSFTCNMAPTLLNYGHNAVFYRHDPVFHADQNQAVERLRITWDVEHHNKSLAMIASTTAELSFERGIIMVVHSKILGTAYVSVRSLRAMGCKLPVEMWFRRDEVEPDHPILIDLTAKYGVWLREIADPRASGFYTKLHAVYYTAFDGMLLMDPDNIATKNPTYLFDTPEYRTTGAMFWPDFWRPASTVFNIVEGALLWEVLGMDFVDMFEQESGQVLIDRRRHQKAIDVLMYYGFSQPRIMEEMRFEWGDKDLFRFAWLKTNSSFHFIQRPVGLGGRYHEQKKTFCGVTMVQHDPRGEIVFLHRNAEKFFAGSDNKRVWTHLQQFHVNASLDHYKLVYQNWVFDDTEHCYRLDDQQKDYFDMTPMAAFPFGDIETVLLGYATDAGDLIGYEATTKPTPAPTPPPTPTSTPTVRQSVSDSTIPAPNPSVEETDNLLLRVLADAQIKESEGPEERV